MAPLHRFYLLRLFLDGSGRARALAFLISSSSEIVALLCIVCAVTTSQTTATTTTTTTKTLDNDSLVIDLFLFSSFPFCSFYSYCNVFSDRSFLFHWIPLLCVFFLLLFHSRISLQFTFYSRYHHMCLCGNGLVFDVWLQDTRMNDPTNSMEI